MRSDWPAAATGWPAESGAGGVLAYFDLWPMHSHGRQARSRPDQVDGSIRDDFAWSGR